MTTHRHWVQKFRKRGFYFHSPIQGLHRDIHILYHTYCKLTNDSRTVITLKFPTFGLICLVLLLISIFQCNGQICLHHLVKNHFAFKLNWEKHFKAQCTNWFNILPHGVIGHTFYLYIILNSQDKQRFSPHSCVTVNVMQKQCFHYKMET